MLSKIMAIFMCIVSFFSATFTQLFSEVDIKKDMAKGNYESPYIVRPLSDITVNGVSVDDFYIVTPDTSEDTLYGRAAQTLTNEIHKACGKDVYITTKEKENAFVISENLYDTDTFTLQVENGKVILTGGRNTGISRGIVAFAQEVLLCAEGSIDLVDGYTYTKTFSGYVTYEQFGAVGDGKTDDHAAIVETHIYANANGLAVFANETATYYIGFADKTALVKTDVDWSTARFIIDDTNVQNRSAWIFNVCPTDEGHTIQNPGIGPIAMDANNIGMAPGQKSLAILTNTNVKRYIRKGANQNDGSNQADVILVDENGNIDPCAPLIWDFDTVTSIRFCPIDEQVLTIRGGHFTTIANQAASEYTYYTRGIMIRRSNTVIENVWHDVIGEGKTGSPYSAFVSISNCADVTVRECTFTGHKKYKTIGSAGTSVTMGTYDIGASTAINTSFINCKQTNDITDGDYWGIAGTNYCKNLVYDGCALSRYDAHQGVRNATIRNSVLGHHGIKLIGSGTAKIENCTVLSNVFVDLRGDYGSTWNGDLIIRNCKYYPTGMNKNLIGAENTEDHNFGYTCHLPGTVEIDGLFVHGVGKYYLYPQINPKHNSDDFTPAYPVVPTQKIVVNGFETLSGSNLQVSQNKYMFDVEIEN